MGRLDPQNKKAHKSPSETGTSPPLENRKQLCMSYLSALLKKSIRVLLHGRAVILLAGKLITVVYALDNNCANLDERLKMEIIFYVFWALS